jgi:ribosomal protein S4
MIRRRKFDDRFISLRLARLYFITLQDYQFRRLFRISSKKDGNLENNYCLMLECRLISIFYRTNFMSNIFEIIKFVKFGLVLFDFKKFKYVNNVINKFSFITCAIELVKKLKKQLYIRVKSQSILFNTPKFLFISYTFFYAYLRKLPIKKDFVYPFRLDIQRITGYN